MPQRRATTTFHATPASACGPVLAPHQAARGLAHRLHGGDRDAARRADAAAARRSLRYGDRRHRARGRRRRGVQLPRGAEDRRGDGAHARASHGDRHDHARRRSCSARARSAASGSRSSGTRSIPLTMWLTLATFVGYAVVYTVILKPATPQNIVIGGASGRDAAGAGLGGGHGRRARSSRCCSSSSSSRGRRRISGRSRSTAASEYERAGVPMLPVTHGEAFTRLHLLLYTLLLVATTLLPFATGHGGLLLPGRGAGARRGVPRLRGGDLAPLQRRARAGAPSPIRSSTWRCSSRC